MATIQAAQEAVLNAVSGCGVQFTCGISKDSHGEYINVQFENWPLNMKTYPTSVGGYRVMYSKLAGPILPL